VERNIERKHNPNLTTNARTLRKNMTKEERHLWYDFLRGYHVRFLRQKVIDRYIVDFYCHDARLVVELDGSQHFDPANIQQDRLRTMQLESRNLKVIRIPNNEVNRNFRSVCEYIDLCVKNRVSKVIE
jgi:very-short-patch-repair endonuclease